MTRSAAAQQKKAEGQSFWDKNPCGGNWSDYASFLAWIRRTEPYAFEIVDRYPWLGRLVLDVGCGQGKMVYYLRRLGARVFGLDMSPVSLRRAVAGLEELSRFDCACFSLADAEYLPFPAACFDAVLSFGVLHHTPDTAGGVRELWRVLKPGGLAIVMLYRSGNPKWWMTCLLRGLSSLVDLCTGEACTIANRLRARHGTDEVCGTALLELFGVPILKVFSNRQARAMFGMFSEVRISNHQPGFRRMADVLPLLRSVEPFLSRLDRQVKAAWGFYQVVEARK